jgi:hypothetical protein
MKKNLLLGGIVILLGVVVYGFSSGSCPYSDDTVKSEKCSPVGKEKACCLDKSDAPQEEPQQTDSAE